MEVKRKSSRGKRWTNSRKVKIDDIVFDSKIEGYMYTLLENSGIKFSYIGNQKSKYTLISEGSYKGSCYERAQKRSKEMRDVSKISSTGYTPDFAGEKELWFIEVKGRKLGDFSIRWKLFKHSLNKKKVKPLLFMPVTKTDCEQVIKILKSKGYDKN